MTTTEDRATPLDMARFALQFSKEGNDPRFHPIARHFSLILSFSPLRSSFLLSFFTFKFSINHLLYPCPRYSSLIHTYFPLVTMNGVLFCSPRIRTRFRTIYPVFQFSSIEDKIHLRSTWFEQNVITTFQSWCNFYLKRSSSTNQFI